MDDKAVRNFFPLEDYYPQKTPQSLQVLLSQQDKHQKSRIEEVKIVTIDQFNMLAVKVRGSMENFEAGQEVRKGWKKLQNIISSEKLKLIEEKEGIVFYNQGNMIRAEGKIELWVGVKVKDNTLISEECNILTIPQSKYAKINCTCFSRAEMDRRYSYLNGWINEKGYQIDYGPNAFSLEPNRLDTFNPFDVPSRDIQAFDFDILYPIK